MDEFVDAEVRVSIEKYACNSALRQLSSDKRFQELAQLVAEAVSQCADSGWKRQVVKVGIVSDNGSVDLRFDVRRTDPSVQLVKETVLKDLDTKKK